MKVHCQNAVDTGSLKHIGNNLRTDGYTSRARTSVLTCIAIVRYYTGDMTADALFSASIMMSISIRLSLTGAPVG